MPISSKDTLRKTTRNISKIISIKKDPQFVSLYDELKRLFDKKNLDELTQEDMKANIGSLEEIYREIRELNRINENLKAKYANDPKYARLHKRIMERGNISKPRNRNSGSTFRCQRKI